MYVALDKNGNRIYADDEQRYIECFCPACGEPLIHRKGTRKRVHFAHKQKTNCFMRLNKDYMSEWHIRMQSFFPKESREYRFKDNVTGEVHIADVFDWKTNTVIEFQHSPMHEEEYLSRTYFHLNNGRRIVWIFDESRESEKLLLAQDPWKEKIEAKAREIEEYKAKTKENESKMRNEIRIRERKDKGLDTDLTKCPLCGGLLKLKTSKIGNKFYGCINYPKCNYTENYYDSVMLYML